MPTKRTKQIAFTGPSNKETFCFNIFFFSKIIDIYMSQLFVKLGYFPSLGSELYTTHFWISEEIKRYTCLNSYEQNNNISREYMHQKYKRDTKHDLAWPILIQLTKISI